MPRRQTARTAPTTTTTDDAESTTPLDELWEKIESIERDVNRRFDEIEQNLNHLRVDSDRPSKKEHDDDERFMKLCHAVDYLLERIDRNYETLACREMILSLLGQRSVRPFSGRTIRNRELCKRMKRWCLFVALVLFVAVCMSFYGLHRNWCYLMGVVCLIGSFLSSIGLRRIYKIIDIIW